MRPEVSIILPVHNGERFVAAALDSILAQTFQAWEALVIDDGSTDATADILRRYRQEPRLVMQHQANGGSARARNRGLAAAQGEWVAFLDADDLWQPDYLAVMVAALRQAPRAVAAFGGWQYVDEAGRLLPQRVMPYGGDGALLAQELHWKSALVPAAVVARRTAVAACGGFDDQLLTAEDWDLWLRLLPCGEFVGVPGFRSLYRQNANSKTTQTERAEKGRLLVVAKHFGSRDDLPPEAALKRQRATANIYLASALAYLSQQQVEAAIPKTVQAVLSWPHLVDRPELYYELGAAFQARGWRGAAEGLRLDESTALIRELIAKHWPVPPGHSRNQMWGYACLVLCQLAYQAGDRAASRRLALEALRRAHPRHKTLALRRAARALLPWRAPRPA